MDKNNIALGDTKIEKSRFHSYKNPIQIDDADIDKIVISNRISFRKKNL